MSTKYYELILSGRQLVLVAASLVALMVVAFVLGVGVGLQEPVSVEPSPAAYVPSDAAAVPVASPSPLVQSPLPVELAEALAAASPLPTPAAAPARPTAMATAAATVVAAAEPIPTAMAVPAARETQTSPEPSHWVQVAALSRQDLADGVRLRIVALGFRPEQVVVRSAVGSYRVRLGPFPDEASTRRVVSRLRAQGFADAFPVTE